jgi:hypothetical protein
VWEFTSVDTGVTGLITLDDSSPFFEPFAFLGGSSAVESFRFEDGTGFEFPGVFHLGITLGPEPANPAGARLDVLAGEDYWKELSILSLAPDIHLVTIRLDPRPVPPGGVAPAGAREAIMSHPNYDPISQSIHASDGVLTAVPIVPEPGTLIVWGILILAAGFLIKYRCAGPV